MNTTAVDSLSQTTYKLTPLTAVLGCQMLFVAFGALVLVPLLTGLDPNVALFTAGVGTLLFQIVTRGQVPVFLASSFAFIAPIIYGTQTWGLPATLCGLAAAGVMYGILSAVVRLAGVQFLHKLLPPVVIGPVIMVIGIILAPVAVNLAMGRTGDGSAVLVPYATALPVATVSLAAVVLFSMLGRGLLRLLSILCGLVVGYSLALVLGLVDFSPVVDAPWLRVPAFVAPQWSWQAIVFIAPVALAPAIEHFGDILTIGSVTGRDYVAKPGIHRTLLGDGIATFVAAILGGPPNTTYSEVTGAVAITRAFNPAIMTCAAVVAILLAFIGKVGGLLQTIPTPVMGGLLIILFGAIVVIGLNLLVKAGENLLEPRNLAIVALVLVTGVGGLSIGSAEWALKGIGLAGIIGVVANLLLPGRVKLS
ncbi:MAG: uracil-xanthine permease family protein [Gammaproteobacteria bacterium]|jgi:uracil permease|nr:uracil-xanthine permease family protein [Gammaproteobacteria bacterium]MDX2458972.1 uracil-xanthine permease family protein [Gammaproteobacteria bacterium]